MKTSNPIPSTEETSLNGVNIQYGSGWSCPAGWLNFDTSPSLKLERIPLLGRFIKVNQNRFPSATLVGDIIAGLPVSGNSAKAIYASHVLEHLSFKDCHRALNNTFSMLVAGGVFRLIVPDLEARMRQYFQNIENENSESGNIFCRSTLFGTVNRPSSMGGKIRSAIGNSHHLWMWDERSMIDALKMAGFVDIRRCKFGDAADPDFSLVESKARFIDTEYNISELALEARKPQIVMKNE